MAKHKQDEPTERKSRCRSCCGCLWRGVKVLVLLALLVCVAYVLWANWHGERETQRMLDELRQRDMPTSYSDVIAESTAVEPQRDGTHYYRAAMALADIPDHEAEGMPVISISGTHPTRGQSIDDELAEKLRSFVNEHQTFYDVCATALRYEYVDDRRSATEVDLEALGGARRVARLLQLRSMERTAAGDADGAAAALTDILDWSHAMRRHPAQITALIRFSLGALANSELESLLSRAAPGAEALQQYRRALRRECASLQEANALEAEFAMLAEALQHPKRVSARQILNLEGVIVADPYGVMPTALKTYDTDHGGDLVIPNRLMEQPEPWRVRLAVDIARIWSTVCPGAQQIMTARHMDAALNVYDMYTIDPKLFMDQSNQSEQTPSIPTTAEQMRRAISTVVGGAVLHRTIGSAAIDVECYRIEHGHWPETLAALPDGAPNDPYADAPLQYKRTDNGVIIYSVGRNREDDGGDQRGMVVQDGDVAFRLFDPDARGTLAPLPAPESDGIDNLNDLEDIGPGEVAP